jgi:thioredoxin-like negative regulator of GroEL
MRVMPTPPYTSLEEADYHRRLAERGGVALVLFSSPDCGACRMVERRLPAVMPEGVGLFRVDVQRATGLARAFEIFHLPALLLYRDGQFHAVLDTVVAPVPLRQAIEAALAAPAREEP